MDRHCLRGRCLGEAIERLAYAGQEAAARHTELAPDDDRLRIEPGAAACQDASECTAGVRKDLGTDGMGVDGREVDLVGAGHVVQLGPVQQLSDLVDRDGGLQTTPTAAAAHVLAVREIGVPDLAGRSAESR